MRTEQRQRLLTILAIAAVVLLVGDKFILTPLSNLWTQRADEIRQLRARIDRGEFLLEQEVRTEAIWRDMKNRSLPSDRSIAEDAVLSSVDQWSLMSRATITSISPQWRTREEDHTLLECRVESVGSLESLARFLYELDRERMALRVESVELTSRDKRGRELAMDLRFSGLNIPEESPNPETAQ